MKQSDKARYEKLLSALRRSEVERQEHERAWDLYADIYASREDESGDRTEANSKRRVNLAFQTVQIMVSNAQEDRPKIYASPSKPESIQTAKTAEKALAFWSEKNRTELEIERAHRDAAIFGDGFLKSAWQREISKKVDPDPEEYQALLQLRDQREKYGLLTDRDVWEYLRDASVQVVDNRPITKRISPRSVWLDMQAKRWDEMAWIAHRYQRPLSHVKNDLGYKRSVRSKVEASPALDAYSDRLTSVGGIDMVNIVEIWDLHEERLYVANYGQKNDPDALLFDGDLPYAIGHPFTHVPFFEIPDSLYSQGIVELIAPLQLELNDIRNEMSKARRRQRTKFVSVDELWSDDAIEALESENDNQVILLPSEVVRDAGVPLNQLVAPLQGPQTNPELYNFSGLIVDDVYRVTGVTEYDRGLVSSYRSATEVQTVQESSSARMRAMMRAVRYARLDVARREIGLAAQFMDSDEIMRITGEDESLIQQGGFKDGRGNTVFPFNRKDIAGEYEWLLDVGPGEKDDKQARLDRLGQMIQIAAPFPEFNRQAAIMEMFTEFGIVEPARFLSPIPTPMDMQGSIPGGGSAAPGGGQTTPQPLPT